MFLYGILQFSVFAGFVSCILSAESADISFHEDATLKSNDVNNHQAVIREADEQPTNSTKAAPRPRTSDPRANESVCYKDLGCFDNFYPFSNADFKLPDSPAKIGITMTLYTRKNIKNGTGQLLQYNNNDTIKGSHFDGGKPTKIIIHGLSNDLNTEWLHELKDALLKKGDFNVIIVGWGDGAPVEDYSRAVANTRVVATVVHRTIGSLVTFGAKLDRMHLIGHSLGAHTAGYAGHLFKGALQRITGLDPAGPEYDHSPILVILDQTDAKFVDIIHSNGQPLISGGAGLFNQSGHVDFYLNGGKHQPGCKDGISGIGSLLQGQGIAQTLACSHGRSHLAFIESVNTKCPFTAYPCSDYDKFEAGKCMNCGSTGCSELGYFSDQYHARGKMFLNTSPQSPLCGYHYSVTIKGAQVTEDTKGTLSIKLKGDWGDSGFVAATQEDQTLKKGDTFSHILVSPIEVGDVDSLTIKYVKYPGTALFGFGKGEKKYAVDSVEVIAGENGDTFKFCVENKELAHDKEVKAVKSSAQHQC